MFSHKPGRKYLLDKLTYIPKNALKQWQGTISGQIWSCKILGWTCCCNIAPNIDGRTVELAIIIVKTAGVPPRDPQPSRQLSVWIPGALPSWSLSPPNKKHNHICHHRCQNLSISILGIYASSRSLFHLSAAGKYVLLNLGHVVYTFYVHKYTIRGSDDRSTLFTHYENWHLPLQGPELLQCGCLGVPPPGCYMWCQAVL